MKRVRLTYGLFVLIALFFASCSNSEEDPVPQPVEVDPNALVLWEGANINFTKEAGADPTLEENQDRITNAVWLTRGNNGGQIYNAFTETVPNKALSPAGTLWAIGEMSDAESLTFENFRTAVGNPKEVVGKNLLMLIPDDKIVIAVRFTAWDQNKEGGFAYQRSSE